MITAHLPSGYLLRQMAPAPRKGVLAVILLGAVFPDFDMIWFYLIDNRAFHHHYYWVHIPGFWALLALVVLPLLRAFMPRVLPYALWFLAAIFLHLILDTLTGAIAWAWPLRTDLYALVTVPPTRSNWVLSFIFHWTFAAEITIWGAALLIWWRRETD